MEPKDIVPILIQRMNNLETILVSTLLGFLITTTLALYASYYNSKDDSKIHKYLGVLMLGINVLYIFLSGYYYFMLTHFYAVASILIPYAKKASIVGSENMWLFFKIPRFPLYLSDQTRNFLALLNAPIFPLLFSSFAIIGMYLIFRKHIGKAWHRKIIVPLSVFGQFIVFYVMIFDPFKEFLKCLDLVK